MINDGEMDASGGSGGRVEITAERAANSGRIVAEGTTGKGGDIRIQTQAAYLDTQSSLLSARGATDGGTIRVEATDAEARIYTSAMLDAGGQAGAGGSIVVTAGELYVMGSQIHADGALGGGAVFIGGGARGQDAGIANATSLVVNRSAVLSANATTAGQGGGVVLWADGVTQFEGRVEARGGSQGGDGGFLEVSGLAGVRFGGFADAAAPLGAAGVLLLDPKNITVAATAPGGSPVLFEFVDPNKAAGNGFGSSTAALSTGNVVITAPNDDLGASDAGAAYLFQGADGTLISTLRGSTANDQVGYGGIVALSNGNYVVSSSNWANGAATEAGAVTWGSGTAGVSGVVSAGNSLVGSTAYDNVGSSGIVALSNGNYVVSSYKWDNGAATNAGAVTWGSGTAGVSGVVSAGNSLVGSTANDQVGSNGIYALSNGNYVVSSSNWDNGAATNAGAMTWGSGTAGVSGVVSAGNSLVGSTAGDQVGSGGIVALSNGNYVVRSSYWDNGAATDAGAVTWGSGTAGISGVVSAGNSILGGSSNANLQGIVVDDVNGTFIARFMGDTSGGAGGRAYAGSQNGPGVVGGFLFGDNPAADITIAAATITAITNTGTAVVLQASNDLTVNAAIVSNNGSGNGGAITLQAGRSILLNANIVTDNGNLTLVANETLANGVIDAHRDAGAAVITMAAGTSIDAGTGAVSLTLADGAGKTNTTSGALTLETITAGTLTALNRGVTPGSDLILNGTLTASGTGDAIRLAGDHFINNFGATALSAVGGRWLVFADAVTGNTFGGLLSGNQALWNISDPASSIAPAGNRYVFAQQPVLTLTSTGESKTYGDDLTLTITDNFTAGGFINAAAYGGVFTQDTLANTTSGAAVASSAGSAVTATVAGSPYGVLLDITPVSATTGYALSKVESGLVTVTPKALTVRADDASRGLGQPNPVFSATYSGFIPGEGPGDLSGALAFTTPATPASPVGSYAITPLGLTSTNYALAFADGTLTVGSGNTVPLMLEYSNSFDRSDRLMQWLNLLMPPPVLESELEHLLFAPHPPPLPGTLLHLNGGDVEGGGE